MGAERSKLVKRACGHEKEKEKYICGEGKAGQHHGRKAEMEKKKIRGEGKACKHHERSGLQRVLESGLQRVGTSKQVLE